MAEEIYKWDVISLRFHINKFLRKVAIIMATIVLTPELLKGKASELRALKSEHDQTMNKMNSLIMGLNDIWKGGAQDAYVAKYQGMQSTFTNFSEMLEGYAKLMDIAAERMDAADKEIASTITGFGG